MCADVHQVGEEEQREELVARCHLGIDWFTTFKFKTKTHKSSQCASLDLSIGFAGIFGLLNSNDDLLCAETGDYTVHFYFL